MTEPVEGGSTQQLVWEGITPFGEVQVAGDDGGAALGKDTESSDLDLLIDPSSDTTLLDIGAIRHELNVLLGVPVDVVTPMALPDTFREAVLAEAVPV